MAVRLLFLAPMVLLTPSSGRAAQGVEGVDLRGRVVDEAQRSAAAGAEVPLLTADSAEVGATETGSDGFFLVSAEEPGRYLVRVEAGGYETVVRSVDLENGLRTVPAFVLARTAIPVEGVDVEVESEPLPGRDPAPSARPMNLLAGERLGERGVPLEPRLRALRPGRPGCSPPLDPGERSPPERERDGGG